MLRMLMPMMPVPPMNTAATFNDVIFWIIFGLFVALFLVVTTLWIMGERRIARKSSQVKEAEWQAPLQPLYTQSPIHDEQSPIHTPEEKVLLRL
jgi:hypothetical protein